MMGEKIVEPARARYIPGFDDAKKVVEYFSGVYGWTISGSGPSCILLAKDRESAREATKYAINVISRIGPETVGFICKLDNEGARVISPMKRYD